MLVLCHVCRQKKPRKLAHEHHKVPRAAGGLDTKENLVFLCPTCHDNLHRFAEMIVNGKSPEAVDLATMEYASPAPRSRSLKLAQLVAQSFSVPGIEEQQETVIRVALPTELVKRLRVLASERQGERGKPLSAPKFASLILTQYLIKKGLWESNS